MKTLYEVLNSQLGYQLIFTIIKPGFLQYTQQIIDIFADNGWDADQTTIKALTRDEAKELYRVHKDEDWYDSLCDYMSSGPSRAFMFTKPGRQTNDTYKDVAEIKDGIRKKWGVDDCRNVMHSSDSMSAMEHESRFYF